MTYQTLQATILGLYLAFLGISRSLSQFSWEIAGLRVGGERLRMCLHSGGWPGERRPQPLASNRFVELVVFGASAEWIAPSVEPDWRSEIPREACSFRK